MSGALGTKLGAGYQLTAKERGRKVGNWNAPVAINKVYCPLAWYCPRTNDRPILIGNIQLQAFTPQQVQRNPTVQCLIYSPLSFSGGKRAVVQVLRADA